jgi:hypothetical protein
MQNSFQFIYIRRLNFGLTIWDKSEVLLGTTWELEVPFGEHIGSMMGTKEENKKFLPPSFPKKKKTGLLMSPCRAFHWLHGTFMSKTLCHHFWPGLMTWQHPQKRKK